LGPQCSPKGRGPRIVLFRKGGAGKKPPGRIVEKGGGVGWGGLNQNKGGGTKSVCG